MYMYVIVNGEPRLRNETAEVRQLRGELLAMRDRVSVYSMSIISGFFPVFMGGSVYSMSHTFCIFTGIFDYCGVLLKFRLG